MEKTKDLRNGKEKEWWHDEVVYEIYVQSFNDSNGDGIGDLNGITQKLDYIKNLGVGCIWLSPIMESPFADCGYDISDYYRINPDFGTMEDFERLVQEAHKRNIKIIIDMVLGYTSNQHKWFQQAKKSKESPTRDYYVWGSGENGNPPNNWFSSGSADSAWTYNPETDDYYYHAFLPEQPHLNWQCQELRDKMFEMVKFWLNKGIDGFRLDAINFIISDDERRDNPGEKWQQLHLYDRNQQNLHQIFKKLRKISDQYPEQMMVGEVYPGHPSESKEFYGNGNDENHLNFNFEIIKAAVGDRWYDGDTSPDSDKYIDLDTGYLVHNLREALDKYNIMFKQLGFWPTMALGNHDQPRVFSVFSEFVSDEYRDDIAKIVAGLTLLSKGTPFLYYGEEIGMENMEFDNLSELKDTFGVRYCEYLIDNGVSRERALAITNQFSRDICRTPMQWSDNKNAEFSENDNTWLKVNPNFTAKNAEKQLADDGSILNFYRRLIEIRKTYNSFCSGALIWMDDRSKDYLAFLRKGKEESVLVVLNFSESKQIVKVNYSNGNTGDSSIELLLSNYRRNKRIFQKDIKINPVEIFVGKLN